MTNWTSYNLKEIPFVNGFADAANTITVPAATGLRAFAAVAEDASVFMALYTDLANAAVKDLIVTVKAVLKQLTDIIEGGAHCYFDPGAIFSDMPPDGIGGFLTRWHASFYDEADTERPLYASDSHLSAILIVAGGENPDALDGILAALALLMKKPKLTRRKPAKTVRHLELLEATLPSPPDWHNKSLGQFFPRIADVSDALERVIDAVDVADSMADMMVQAADLAEAKAQRLEAVAEQLNDLAETIQRLIDASGLYVLKVDSVTGVKGLITAAHDADPPPWNAEAYVTGMCLLSPTADFGPLATLLGV